MILKMTSNSRVVALITACGRGTRLNIDSEIPKQYLPLGNMTMLRYTISSFLDNKNIDDVICVINKNDIELYNEAVSGLDLMNPIIGGKTRQESILNGLKSLANEESIPEYILIHDAVRPFVSKKLINGIIEKLKTHPAVIPAIAVDDTVKKISDNVIQWTLERDNLWRAQTPQGFVFDDILNSHIAFKDLTFTDDASIHEYAGIPVSIIPGSQNNFKITTKDDYERAQKIAIYSRNNIQTSYRCGNGFDTHKLEDATERDNKIRLGGVDIEFNKKLIAHSDGDVVIHSLMDAIYGALCLGDIGDHFPDNEKKWHNANSLDMLKITKKAIIKNYAEIENIDITILCEEPKISPFKSEIIKIIAKTLEISQNKVNVKATTTEKLGFLGRKEALACITTCMIKIIKEQ
ncbi:MAG: bifunctional 2-C-methyl-D-erythritol 4-phosphate cytidylyltransferase/2-C-methyl-D-erythritol 2,4-cyclodiphosphate synthase [Rickettsiales bacterium]|nr:bifunctional 2-C-methyl-D-erythritol 4-phosphate cytidylyltransferase/2-C-methyl-D-erythritol 2,4-cyclodiphosphate synthase [Rickettsiales bacterium]|tara:strand:+ start:2695 stop:3912 length:1218 start_codon:yes stop_codon:yes gene_type:complete